MSTVPKDDNAWLDDIEKKLVNFVKKNKKWKDTNGRDFTDEDDKVSRYEYINMI